MLLSTLKTTKSLQRAWCFSEIGFLVPRKGMDKQLKLLVTAGAVVFGGIFGLSMVSSIALKGVQVMVEVNKKATAPPCRVCKGKGFTPCKLCQEKSVIYWSPLYDPVVPRPCLCPTCDGNRVQRCLNCIGRGYA